MGYEAEILSIAMDRIRDNLFKLNDQRIKMKQLAFLAVGAMIGLSIKMISESGSGIPSIGICYCGVITSVLFWIQDQKLHIMQHSWRNVDEQLQTYLSAPTTFKTFKLFDFKNESLRKTAYWYSDLSIGTYGILILGSVFTGIYAFYSKKVCLLSIDGTTWAFIAAVVLSGVIFIAMSIYVNEKTKRERKAEESKGPSKSTTENPVQKEVECKE
jgi:hypothetical protein